ncbi:unnamed protein product [Closterium sp. NIES-54]
MDAARRARVRLAPPGRSQRGEGGGAKPGRESAREREARRQQLQRSLDEAQKPLAAALAVAWKGAAPPRFLFPFHFTLASQRLSPAVESSKRGKDGERELGGVWGAGDVSHYEACGAALLHLLAFHGPPALQSVRQAAVRVCARMATAGGRWWRESVMGALLLALSAYVDAPDDHVVLDACTALTASLLALPPQPPSRPLRHAPIPTLPSSLLAPPPTMLSPSPPSASPLALPLATVTPPLLASLWRLHLSPSSAAPSTNGGEGTKGGKARCGGEGRRGGVVARAAEWLWGAAGTGDGRGVGGEAVVGPEGREGGMGGAGVHAHTATASSGGDACGGVVGTDGGSQAHSSTCSSSTPTDSRRLGDSSSSGREKKSSDDEPMAPWKKRQAAAVAAVLHVLVLLLQRCPAGGREVKREVFCLPAHLSGGRGRMAQLVGMALPHGAHIDGSAAAVSEAALSLLSAMGEWAM